MKLLRFAFALIVAAVALADGSAGPATALSSDAVPASRSDPKDFGRPSVRVFTSKDGLPQNAVMAIVTDKDGLLWIGTKDGVASYDGRSWHAFKMPSEAGSNSVKNIVATSTGDMWFGLIPGGLVRRSPSGETTVYLHPAGDENDYPRGLGEVSEPDRPGTVILAGTHRVARFHDGEWVIDKDFDAVSNGREIAYGNVVHNHDGEEEFWVSLVDGTTVRLRSGVWTAFPFSRDGKSGRIYQFVMTASLGPGRQLIAGTTTGVSVFDGSGWSELPGLPDYLKGRNIFTLADAVSPGGQTALWAADINGPMFRYAHGGWSPALTQVPSHGMGIWSMLATGDANATNALWIGTAGGGLLRLQFGQWTAFDKAIGLVSTSIYSILVSEHPVEGDVVWIGAISGGLVRFANGKAAQIRHPDGTWIPWPMCLLEVSDSKTERVLAGEDGRLSVIENGRVSRVFTEKDGVTGHDVTCLLRSTDGHGRQFVYVGADRGVCRLVGDRILPGPVRETGRVSCLAESATPGSEHTLWVGTETGALICSGQTVTKLDMSSGIPARNVLSMREVTLPRGKREMWIGTGAGVARVECDPPYRVLGVLSTSTSALLPNDTIYRIEADARGRIYMPTNRGIVRLTPDPSGDGAGTEFKGTVFTTDDGLPNDECNTGASTVDHHGRVWVGTLGGVAMFDPEDEVVPRPSKLIFTRRSVVDDVERPLNDNVDLAHNRNHVVFEFALLSYCREASTAYQTQLVGYENEPAAWSRDGRREFNSLPAGSFEFRVWGRDASGNVSGPITAVFVVRPAPWLTWWAFALYGLAVLGTAFVAFRWRLRSLAQRNVDLQAAIAERTAELARTVSELQTSQLAAVASEREAQEANLAKSVFLANMSHELRTPLNAVLGFAQLLDRTGALGVQERHQVGIIRRSGEHLLGLINDVLSLAKIEAGKLELHELPFAPRELLGAVEAMMRVRAEAKDLVLVFEVGEDFPPVVLGDDGKLRQVLLNLLGNAVKFTDKGSVRLRASWCNGRASFEVSDDGQGIAPDERERLFEAFSQTSSGLAASEGTGLGLAISRQIVRLMGGDISVSSVVGRGSTFRFDMSLPATLEQAVAHPGRRILRVSSNERRRRVLVVDDSTENRLLLVTLLNSVGLDVREARDGAEAVAISEAWHPRVIFMDRRMPVMDGTESTRRIRAREQAADPSAPRSVIIATTASVFEQERAEILANGCDDLVMKPFHEHEIFAMLERHAHMRFDYADDPREGGSAVDSSESMRQSAGRIRALDPDIAMRLYDALNLGDAVLAAGIAAEIERIDLALGREILREIRDFNVDGLLAALEEELG